MKLFLIQGHRSYDTWSLGDSITTHVYCSLVITAKTSEKAIKIARDWLGKEYAKEEPIILDKNDVNITGSKSKEEKVLLSRAQEL